MAMCPLCSSRPAKRYCPAVADQICPVCCGTKREIEIDCPSSCPYLKSSRSYEAEKRVPDAELASKAHRYNEDFIARYHPVLDALTRSVGEERLNAPWLVDNDVIEVYKALSATMKTLSSGIYYESLPDGPARVALFHRLKAVLDEVTQPDPNVDRSVLKVGETIDVLEFLTFAAQLNSSVRPKGRRYLDWISEMSGTEPQTQSSGIILP
ncbi:MAG: hypothetical protein DMG15_02765 [Acidobacteria bacterium]|nr:MAG: hypothetical protein DMG15_02765 [Acidobacteriota bacterium]